MLKVLILLLCTSVFSYKPKCNEHTALIQLRKPTYDFSVRLLDRVAQETGGHFVFSPLTTWLQLITLADGARDKTLNEILMVTRYHRLICFRKLVRKIFNNLDEELSGIAKRRSIIVIEKLLDLKKSYKRRVEKLKAAKILSLNFKKKSQSAAKVNKIIEIDTNGIISEAVVAQDFNMSVLLMTDVAYLKADWRSPFNPVYTKKEPFYTEDKVVSGEVNMMHQVGFFNLTYVPPIKAHALELPFNERVSMIFLLPKAGKAGNLFWLLKDIRLMTIYSLFKMNGLKLVNVNIPRFNLTSDIDNIPELLSDMGVHKIFNPNKANLSKISDYKVFVSMMTSIVNIVITEKGVLGSVGPEFLISPGSSEPVYFTLNRPFAYLIADRKTDAILFAGIYSKPTVY